MASRKSMKLKTSEETFDYTCSVCSKKNRTKEAVKYCQECHKYLCTSCLEHHKDYMEDHTLTDPSAARDGVVLPTEKCRKHGQKLVEMWCKNHDEVLCNTCAFMEHRLCKEVKFIPGEIDDLLQDGELQETIDGLKRTRERLATLMDERSLTGERLLGEKNKYLEMVEIQKRKILQIVESLGKVAIEEINVWYNENKSKLDEDQECRDQLERDTISSLQQLETPTDNRSQLFVSMKKGQKMILTAKSSAASKNKHKSSGMRYAINLDIEENLNNYQSLGLFQKQNHLYKVSEMKRINVKENDLNVCSISDTCLMPDGSILITDSNNNTLKRLDNSTYTVTDHCQMPSPPYGVCYVGEKNVAVSLYKERKIQLVSVGKTLTLTWTISVNYPCFGLCYSDGELFVSDADTNVYVYNLSGTLLRTIYQTPSGEFLFSQNRLLAINGDMVYIADMDRGLICIDKNGTELFQYRGTQVKGGCGVCTDGQGGVFLCGIDSHNVVQVGENGEEINVVLTQADGLKYPRSLSFDQSKQILIVTQENRNEISVSELT